MKKIYQLLALAAITASFSACRPLDKTYDELGGVPVPVAPATSSSITLTAADYGLLPSSNYAKTSLSFKTKDDAASSIPTILASKYPTYGEKSAITVTYGVTNPSVKPADSLITNISYTVTTADYATVLGANPRYLELNDAQAKQFLGIKYPSAVANQEVMLTYIYYQSGVTSSAVTVTDTFVYLDGVWVKCYTLSSAEFASVGNSYGDFSASDAALIPAYLNQILKSNLNVSAKAKAGDVKYVSYKYYASKNYQRIQALTYNGTDWIVSPTSASLAFVKTNGVWKADNTVTYTLVAADYTSVANATPPFAGIDPVQNLKDHGNFSQQSGSSFAWTDAQIASAVAYVLKMRFPAAEVNQKFIVTYSTYTGATTNVTKTFQYNGTTFVAL